MLFAEKLDKLGKEVNKSRVSRAAGLKANTLSTYIATRSIPRADIALKLARALGVPLEWLVDDTQDWPPPSKSDASGEATSSLQLTDNELMIEVCRRFRLVAVPFRERLAKAMGIDWNSITSKMLELPIESDLPPEAADATSLAVSLANSVEQLFQFDPDTVVYNYHGALPGKALDPGELTLAALLYRWRALRDANPGLLSVYDREMSRRAHSRRTRQDIIAVDVSSRDKILDIKRDVSGKVADLRRDVSGNTAQKPAKPRKPQTHWRQDK